ncbi:acetylxylan esterase [Abditibacteriota bacterium]|nr:acetylxylan esterase [Abditibacteriota bacterium]
MLQQDDHIVFYGDSITDCGRNRDALPGTEAGWGNGYVQIIAENLRVQKPDLRLQFTNKGVSGNRIYDLEERLERDVLSLRPELVSILIGINDVWREFDSQVPSPIEDFRASYRRILERIVGAGCELVLLDPFLLHTKPEFGAWRPVLDPKIEVVRELAQEFATLHIPLDDIFTRASQKREPALWAGDGVHPSLEGHALIAQSWLQAVAN